MKKQLMIGAVSALALCALASPAMAGQGFYVTFDSSASSAFPTTTIGNIDYKNWYQNDISAGTSISGASSKRLYTERCAAFFGCGSASGNSSLNEDGVLWALMEGSTAIINFCISNDGPISTTCGVQGTPNSSQLTYDNWIAGCNVPGGGYTCTVTSMGQSGDQIAITYTLGLPPTQAAR